MRISTPAFFCFPFAWNIFFHPLTFSLYVSLGLKWVSCRQHIYGSCICIHSASLCLLVGTFNLLTFKIIIDILVPISIFLIVWGWFCRSFFSLVFLDYIGTFKFCFKADLVVLNSLNFCLSCLCLICRLDFLARSYVYARADLILSVAICLEYWACFLDSPDVEDFWVVSLTLWMWCHGGMYCVLLLHWTWWDSKSHK